MTVVNEIINGTENEHSPNKVCSSNQNQWNYERIIVNEPIVEAYFLPLSTNRSTNNNQQNDRSGWWQKFTNIFWSSTPKIEQKSPELKARIGQRKRKPEARLTISPLECHGFSE